MTDWASRETRNGETLTKRVWALLEDAYAAAGIPVSALHVSQGSWSAGSLSGSTHLGGGAFDLRTWTFPADRIEPLVVELRRRNVCAWFRDQAHGGFQPHVHGIVRDEPGLSSGARWQCSEYDAGRDGLNRRGPDYHPRPTQRPFDPEADVALTDAEIDRIADAVAEKVWRRTVEVDGVARKMGSLLVACWRVARAQLPSGVAEQP